MNIEMFIYSIQEMNKQKKNTGLIDKFGIAGLFYFFAFIAVAIAWFVGMIGNLGLWVNSAYEQNLEKTEPICVYVLEIINLIARFPSVCIESWEDNRVPEVLIYIGWIIDSLFWSFVIIYLCRLVIQFVAARVFPNKTQEKLQ